MTGKRRLRFAIQVCLIVLGLTSLGVLLVGYQMEKWRAPTRALWSQLHMGNSEAYVRKLLGEPRYEYERDSAPVDYYVSGYGRCERAISNRVLIYFGNDLILYVYLNGDNEVEQLCSASS